MSRQTVVLGLRGGEKQTCHLAKSGCALAHSRFNNNENIMSQTLRIDRTPSKGGDLKAHHRSKLRKKEIVEPGNGEEEGEKV